jgi:hypothetical protein
LSVAPAPSVIESPSATTAPWTAEPPTSIASTQYVLVETALNWAADVSPVRFPAPAAVAYCVLLAKSWESSGSDPLV